MCINTRPSVTLRYGVPLYAKKHLFFRYTFRFKWSDSLVQDGPPSVIQDAQFEIASVLMEAAIWLIKYGARIAGKEDITEADAKIVHKAFSFTIQIVAR